MTRSAPIPPRRSTTIIQRWDREPRSVAVAYGLWALGAVGLCGIHRFYCRKPLSGTLWLVSVGLCWLGQLVDLVLIPGLVRQANQALLLEQALARPAEREQPSLEWQLLRLARDRGDEGFTINDAVLELSGGTASGAISSEIERLLHEHLLDVGNDRLGRVVYREP
ncbi:MAG: NINE protein [Cyanobacteriota bacterium]|nr:NINE protein [Cyanobacteriota bacterium]